jgi:hypothetical protein
MQMPHKDADALALLDFPSRERARDRGTGLQWKVRAPLGCQVLPHAKSAINRRPPPCPDKAVWLGWAHPAVTPAPGARLQQRTSAADASSHRPR